MKLKYYKQYSMPLEEVEFEEIPVDEIVFNEVGKCMQKVQSSDSEFYMKEIYDSVLIEGEVMQDLTKVQLDLFWRISKNKGKKWYHESKDSS